MLLNLQFIYKHLKVFVVALHCVWAQRLCSVLSGLRSWLMRIVCTSTNSCDSIVMPSVRISRYNWIVLENLCAYRAIICARVRSTIRCAVWESICMCACCVMCVWESGLSNSVWLLKQYDSQILSTHCHRCGERDSIFYHSEILWQFNSSLLHSLKSFEISLLCHRLRVIHRPCVLLLLFCLFSFCVVSLSLRVLRICSMHIVFYTRSGVFVCAQSYDF